MDSSLPFLSIEQQRKESQQFVLRRRVQRRPKNSRAESQIHKEIEIPVHASSQDTSKTATVVVPALHSSTIPVHIKVQVKTWLQQRNNKQPNVREFQELLSLTGLKYSQLYPLLRRLREIRGSITGHNRKMIRDWVLENPDSVILSKEKLLNLCTDTGLSEQQVRNQIQIQKEAMSHAEITPELKSYLLQWVLKHRRLPNTLERHHIMGHTRMSPSQLRGQLALMLDVKGKITEEKREYLQKWLEEKTNAHGRKEEMANDNPSETAQQYIPAVRHHFSTYSPTPEELAHLTKLLSLSRRQIQYLVPLLQEQRTEVTFQKKIEIARYIDELGRYPLRGERKDLETRTGLSSSQIRDILKHMKQKSGPVTDESKKIVANWLHENKNRLPTDQERSQLLKETGWNGFQLTSQLRYMRDKQGVITEEIRQSIKEWLETIAWRSPTIQERRSMREELGLSRTQLNAQVRRLTKQHMGRV